MNSGHRDRPVLFDERQAGRERRLGGLTGSQMKTRQEGL
jgi:hypothetical protein